jgi:IMP dehydrogenase
VAEIEIGIGKSGRRAYGFDDIAIVPSRRTRDPEDIDVRWQIDAYEFSLPLLERTRCQRRARRLPRR